MKQQDTVDFFSCLEDYIGRDVVACRELLLSPHRQALNALWHFDNQGCRPSSVCICGGSLTRFWPAAERECLRRLQNWAVNLSRWRKGRFDSKKYPALYFFTFLLLQPEGVLTDLSEPLLFEVASVLFSSRQRVAMAKTVRAFRINYTPAQDPPDPNPALEYDLAAAVLGARVSQELHQVAVDLNRQDQPTLTLPALDHASESNILNFLEGEGAVGWSRRHCFWSGPITRAQGVLSKLEQAVLFAFFQNWYKVLKHFPALRALILYRHCNKTCGRSRSEFIRMFLYQGRALNNHCHQYRLRALLNSIEYRQQTRLAQKLLRALARRPA